MSYRQRIALDYVLGVLGTVALSATRGLDLTWYWDWPLMLVCWLCIFQFIDLGRMRERRETQRAMGMKQVKP